MVFQLVSCPPESFIPYTSDPEEDSTTTEALDEKYLGNLIIRTLDLLLDKRMKYLENGGKNNNVYEVAWNLLLDREYSVFEDSSNAICSIVSRPGEEAFLNQERLALLLKCVSGEMEVF
eukprot:XP_762907.1 hypothetical protein [Theileria parva strain Muguga]